MCAVGRTDRLIAQLEYLSDHGSSDAVKIRALELLGKTCGMFKPQPEPVPTRSPEEIQHSSNRSLECQNDRRAGRSICKP
jgi:hypothetical protein